MQKLGILVIVAGFGLPSLAHANESMSRFDDYHCHPKAAKEQSHNADQQTPALLQAHIDLHQLADEPQETTQSNYLTTRDNIRRAIARVEVFREDFPRCIANQRIKQNFFDTTMIGIGNASVSAAFARASSPVVGGLAIASGGLGQYRGYYKNEQVGLTYILALKTVRCISSEAERLPYANVLPLYKDLGRINIGISVLESALAKSPATGDDAKDLLKAANQAITTANDTFMTVRQTIDDYDASASVINKANDAVRNYIDIKRHRQTVVLNDVETAIRQQIKDEIDSAVATRTAREAMIQAFTAQAQASSTSTPTANLVSASAVKSTRESIDNAAQLVDAPASGTSSTPVVPVQPASSTNATTDAGKGKTATQDAKPQVAGGSGAVPAPAQAGAASTGKDISGSAVPPPATSENNLDTQAAAKLGDAKQVDQKVSDALRNAKAAANANARIGGLVAALNILSEAAQRDLPPTRFAATNLAISACLTSLQ